MNEKTDRPLPEERREAASMPRKRFRIDKIEERIAPKKHSHTGSSHDFTSSSYPNSSIF